MTKSDYLNINNLDISAEDKITAIKLTDFKSFIEDSDYQYIEGSENSIENFLNYKFLGKYDCDKIFGKMFDYEHTDTMNSFWTLFKQYIKVKMSSEFELEDGEIKQDYIDTYKKQYDFELTSQQLWIVHILNIMKKKNIEFDDYIKNFAVVTHTIGNFMEVPAGFNANRYTNTLDYFDLTLLCIYKWYQTNSDFWLEILLNNNQEAIQNTKDWLLSYNMETEENYTAWEIFIGLNNLEGFIDDNHKPIEFFLNHFNRFEILITDRQKFANYSEKSKLLNPQTNGELINCITNINNSINFRGEYIANDKLEETNNSQQEQKQDDNTFDKVIITNKTQVNFPIKAYVMDLEEFLKRAENSIQSDEFYIDIDVLDIELYNNLKSTGAEIIYIRLTPSYIQEEILDWRV